ncbi:hypothetical protein FOLKNPGA_01746 [Legionella sp. PC1000]|uniref:hypothetical protein n=1 Tax=Legionella sp. PC1000 TaxID=2746060 RepID=UPI0015FD1268|nr:hypothetical protein [Legionella sp. PC1000]QLZ68966.1 hypothetical protein FOLKNPGA_01746 [Legionella sp. PC1000]
MNKKTIENAILELRAEILIKKLLQNNKYLSTKDAQNLVTRYSDTEAFEKCMKELSNSLSSWAKERWYRVLRILQK